MAAPGDSWYGKSVFVTGATGLLGRALVNGLARRGCRVTALVHRRRPEGFPNSVRIAEGSVLDAGSLERALAEVRPAVIFHLAAQALADSGVPAAETLDINVRGVWTVLEAAAKAGTGVAVVASSAYAADVGSPYAVCKRCAELICRLYAGQTPLRVGIARCCNVFGPGDTNFSRLIPGAIQSAIEGRPFVARSDGTAQREFVYAPDAAEALVLLAEHVASSPKSSGQVFNVSSGSPVRVADAVHAVFQASVPGWRPSTPFDQALRETVAWYRKPSSGLRVALYYPWVYLTSGAERSILELTGRSRHEWTIFTSHFDAEHTFPGFADRNVVRVGHVGVGRSPADVAAAALRIAQLRLPSGYDALVVVCEGLGDLITFRNAADGRAICLCLTPLRAAYDRVYREHWLEGKTVFQKLAVRAALPLFRIIDRFAWKRYAKVFCISKEAKQRAVDGKLHATDEIEILHPGLGFEPVSEQQPSDRYFLLPGRIMWTKNIELGIDAFRHFRQASPAHADFRLVIAGIVDAKSAPYLESLRRRAGGDANIEFRIFPSDSELADLYRRCYGVLFTAFNEDWGIVPLEGMAFAKPVIAVNSGGPAESVEHGVTGFLEPPNAGRFAARMAELANDPDCARQMGARGNLGVRLYSWDRFAARIDDEVERLAALRAAGADGRAKVRPQPALSNEKAAGRA